MKAAPYAHPKRDGAKNAPFERNEVKPIILNEAK